MKGATAGVKSRQERDARYSRSDKGRARHRRYNASGKGWERSRRYEQTAKAIRRKIDRAIRLGHDPRVLEDALEERERYEASGSSLTFVDWRNKNEPLPRLRSL